MFTLGDPNIPNSFKISTLYILIVPDNREALQVFENDEQEHLFFEGKKEKEEESFVGSPRDVAYKGKILRLKDNYFLEDFVSLESNFTRNDGAKVETQKKEKYLRKVQ